VEKIENKFLFLVVLGGRVKKANIELHDVRWVVGSKIEDTYEILRKDWFGSLKGLHIDSYKKIKYIAGNIFRSASFEITKPIEGDFGCIILPTFPLIFCPLGALHILQFG